jgi:hypothetical protein
MALSLGNSRQEAQKTQKGTTKKKVFFLGALGGLGGCERRSCKIPGPLKIIPTCKIE